MKKLLYVFLGIVILLVAAAIIIPMTINPNDYKPQIAKMVEEKSGYKLDLAGDIKISLLPSVKASIADVSVSTGKNEPFAKVKELNAYMKIQPLLSGKVEVDEIKVVEPKLNLVQQGKTNNWTATKPAVKKEEVENAEKKDATKREIKISEFSIVNGDVAFNNNGNKLNVRKVNLSAGLDNDNANIKKFAADIFGGHVEASGKVKLGDSPSTQIKFDGSNFDLAQITKGLMRNERVEKGTADLSGDLNFAGMTPDRIFATLDGSGKISATKLEIRGFDAGEFSRNVQAIKSPADVLPMLNSLRGENKTTKIESIAGDFSVKNGLVNLPGIKLEADYAQGDYSGVIDLPRSVMNTEAKFNLVFVDKGASPKLGLRISGPMSSPNLQPDLSDITRWAVGKYGNKLMEKVPEKYKGLLSGF